MKKNFVTNTNPQRLPTVEESMSNTVEKSDEVIQDEQAAQLANATYSESAFGLFKDAQGQWSIMEIKYDPKTLVVSREDITVYATGDTAKAVGLERFKIIVQNQLINRHLYS